jgi:hypothetical protein
MRRLELILGIVMIAVAGFFYYLTVQLPEKAMIYPLFVISLLLVLSLIQLLIAYFKKSAEESTAFKDIKWKQLIFVLLTSGVYVVLINIAGYITSTFIYVLTILLGLNTGRKISIAVSVGFVIALYLLFKMGLNVPLPKGILI